MKRLAFTLLLALVCGAALAQAPFRIPASEQTVNALRSTRVQLVLQHSDLGATYTRAPATALMAIPGLPGVGFLGALMAGAAEEMVQSSRNAERAKQAVALVAPVRNSLAGYEIGERLQGALAEALPAVAWLKIDPAGASEARAETSEEHEVEGTARLLIVARHSTSAGLRFMRLWVLATLLASGDDLKAIAARDRPEDKLPRLFRNEYLSIHTFPGPTIPPAEAAQHWSENEGALVRAALDLAIREVTHMIAGDLADTLPTAAEAPLAYDKSTATLLQRDADRVMLRLANGALRYVPAVFVKAPPSAQN